MLNLSNLLTLLRFPLAFAFLFESPTVRLVAVFAAMLTDFLDGFFARYYQASTVLGTLLDPLMDKFFVCFCLGTLFFEGQLELWQVVLMFSRDIAIFTFGISIVASGAWDKTGLRAVWWGKITTAWQFSVIILSILHVSLPPYCFYAFIVMGVMTLLELHFFDLLRSRAKEVKKIHET